MDKGRLDQAISGLEKAEQEASQILNDHTDELVAREPPEASWSVVRYKRIMAPAGSRLNYLNALKQLRDRLLGAATD
jgi:hypothetical protein